MVSPLAHQFEILQCVSQAPSSRAQEPDRGRPSRLYCKSNLPKVAFHPFLQFTFIYIAICIAFLCFFYVQIPSFRTLYAALPGRPPRQGRHIYIALDFWDTGIYLRSLWESPKTESVDRLPYQRELPPHHCHEETALKPTHWSYVVCP